MSVKVSQMTDVELRQMIGEIVEEKLMALLGDEDENLSLREDLQRRLVEQKKITKNGEHGQAFEDVTAKLGLN